jgi:hypothetical protein
MWMSRYSLLGVCLEGRVDVMMKVVLGMGRTWFVVAGCGGMIHN